MINFQTILCIIFVVLLSAPVYAGNITKTNKSSTTISSKDVTRLMEGALYLPRLQADTDEKPSETVLQSINATIKRIFLLEDHRLIDQLSPVERQHVEYHTRHMRLEAWLAAREAQAVKQALNQGNALDIRAKELYQSQLAKLQVPSEAKITYLFIDYQKRSFEGAVARVEEVRKRLQSEPDFARLAREMTDDPNVRDKGASVTFDILETQADPELAKIIFTKMKPGEVGGPFLIPQGMIFVRLDQLQPAKPTPFEDTRERFRHEALNEVRARARREALAELDQLATNVPSPARLRK